MASRNLATTIIVGATLAGAFVVTEQISPGLLALIPSDSGGNKTGGADQTVQGDPVQTQFGTVQVELVQKSGKIETVTMLQAGATAGREQAFPTLVEAVVQAQGTDFGNLSGATITTDAFKQAVESALSKLK